MFTPADEICRPAGDASCCRQPLLLMTGCGKGHHAGRQTEAVLAVGEFCMAHCPEIQGAYSSRPGLWPHQGMRGKVPSTISRMTAPAAIAARWPRLNRAGVADSICDRGFGIETGFLSTHRVRVGFSISISKNDIIFFSLQARSDYYMEKILVNGLSETA